MLDKESTAQGPNGGLAALSHSVVVSAALVGGARQVGCRPQGQGGMVT